MKGIIDSKDISVVVRGLIVGNNEAEEKKKFTKRSLESVRKFLPDAQLILSTWKGSDVSGLDYDVLTINDEPERIELISDEGDRIKFIAANNQIFSTQKGLEKAERKFVISMRSDIVLTGTGFIRYFLKYNKEDNILDILNKKIVVLPTYNPLKITKILFDVCDWFYFGLTDDIKNIFNIPLMSKKNLNGEKINDYFKLSNNFESEVYIWTSFLKKYKEIKISNMFHFNEELFNISEETYGKYTIMVPAQKLNIKCLKMPNAGYGARPWLSQGLYTYNEYKKIFNKYNQVKIFYFPNMFEKIMYPLALNLRLFVKKSMPGLYKKMVNLIRKMNGSYNFLK